MDDALSTDGVFGLAHFALAGKIFSFRSALALFFIQLSLNAAWSWMFFGANNTLLGVINIVPQFLTILATVASFHRLDRLAALCLLPLAAWVGFASVLNISIWRLNG